MRTYVGIGKHLSLPPRFYFRDKLIYNFEQYHNPIIHFTKCICDMPGELKKYLWKHCNLLTVWLLPISPLYTIFTAQPQPFIIKILEWFTPPLHITLYVYRHPEWNSIWYIYVGSYAYMYNWKIKSSAQVHIKQKIEPL